MTPQIAALTQMPTMERGENEWLNRHDVMTVAIKMGELARSAAIAGQQEDA